MEEVTSNEERIAYLKSTYDLSHKNAAALLLCEIGYSQSGIATALDVTSGTARSYVNKLEERIGQNVTESVPKSVRYATYPGDVPKDDVEYSGGEPETRKDLSPNKGIKFDEIPHELITIKG